MKVMCIFFVLLSLKIFSIPLLHFNFEFFFFCFHFHHPFPSITSLFFSILLSNWKVGGLCSKDMGSYPSSISFTFHYLAFVCICIT